MTYLQAVLGLIQLVSWVMAKLDEQKRATAMAALWDQEFMRRDKELIDHAKQVRADAERRLNDPPDGVLSDDGFRKP